MTMRVPDTVASGKEYDVYLNRRVPLGFPSEGESAQFLTQNPKTDWAARISRVSVI